MLKFMDFHPLAIIFILSEGTDVSKFMCEFKTAYTIDGWHEFPQITNRVRLVAGTICKYLVYIFSFEVVFLNEGLLFLPHTHGYIPKIVGLEVNIFRKFNDNRLNDFKNRIEFMKNQNM